MTECASSACDEPADVRVFYEDPTEIVAYCDDCGYRHLMNNPLAQRMFWL